MKRLLSKVGNIKHTVQYDISSDVQIRTFIVKGKKNGGRDMIGIGICLRNGGMGEDRVKKGEYHLGPRNVQLHINIYQFVRTVSNRIMPFTLANCQRG